MTTNTKKEIEYEDAPCGYATMYNYKEPFMPFKDESTGEGYGYEGVLVFDGESDKVQCHFCGEWFITLGNHLQKEHAMNASTYKEKVGLLQSTALIGEKLRAKFIENGKKRVSTLRPGGKKSIEMRRRIRETLMQNRREKQNVHGTCPAQIVDRLQKLAKELGRCPTRRECTFHSTVDAVYGSFGEACRIAGLTPLKPSQTHRVSKYNKTYFINLVRPFWIKNGRFPRRKDYYEVFGGKDHIWDKYKKYAKDVQKAVLFGEKKYHSTGIIVRYTKDELLDMLVDFKRIHGRDASVSDCKRGLLPYPSRFYYHFGTFREAINQTL